MSVNKRNQTSLYGFASPLTPAINPVIVSTRAPSTTDFAPIGQIWINRSTNTNYILTSVVGGVASWQGGLSGAGTFTTLTSSGNTSLGTGAGSVIAIGNTSGATSITESVGTGNFLLQGAATSTMTIGTGLTTGTILIGSTAQTGQITLGSSSGAGDVRIAAGSGASAVAIANIQTAGSVSIGGGMTSGTISIGGTTLQTGTISIAPGTGAQTVNIGTGGTGVKTINMGTGAVANVVTIGSLTGAAQTIIQSGTAGIFIDAATSNVQVFSTSVTAAGTTVVNNVRVGTAIYTGLTTAAAATETLTLTNSTITATSNLLLSAQNLGGNDAQMTITRILQGAGTCTIQLKNNGAAANNGNVQLSFWCMS